jgi:hypothetical protein
VGWLVHGLTSSLYVTAVENPPGGGLLTSPENSSTCFPGLRGSNMMNHPSDNPWVGPGDAPNMLFGRKVKLNGGDCTLKSSTLISLPSTLTSWDREMYFSCSSNKKSL